MSKTFPSLKEAKIVIGFLGVSHKKVINQVNILKMFTRVKYYGGFERVLQIVSRSVLLSEKCFCGTCLLQNFIFLRVAKLVVQCHHPLSTQEEEAVISHKCMKSAKRNHRHCHCNLALFLRVIKQLNFQHKKTLKTFL